MANGLLMTFYIPYRSSDVSSSRSSTIQLTGDKRADADIMAFIKARQNLLQNKGKIIASYSKKVVLIRDLTIGQIYSFALYRVSFVSHAIKNEYQC